MPHLFISCRICPYSGRFPALAAGAGPAESGCRGRGCKNGSPCRISLPGTLVQDITEGDLIIDGNRVNDVEPKDRDIAMVFQNYAGTDEAGNELVGRVIVQILRSVDLLHFAVLFLKKQVLH